MLSSGLLFLTSAHAAATPRTSLDDGFFVPVGRAGWDPFSRRSLPDIFPFGHQLRQPLASQEYLRRTDPYAVGVGNNGFVLDCETAFTYDVCLNRAKRVCDAFCQNMCREHCGGFDSAHGVMANTTDLIDCLNQHELNNCAYRFGQVTSLPAESLCQTTLKQLEAQSDGSSAVVEVEAITVNIDWSAFTSRKYKHIRKVLLELSHGPEDAETVVTEDASTTEPTSSTDPSSTSPSSTSPTPQPQTGLLYNDTMPQDSTNIIRLISKVRATDAPNAPCGLTGKQTPMIWGDLAAIRWQRLNTFGLPYFADNSIYQVDLTHLYNQNVWNSIGTESTILIWFNRAQPGLKFSQKNSRLIIYGDFSLTKVITKSDIKSTRILTQTATFNDRITEF